MAARHGAQLLLVARNEEALRALTDEINAAGGRAIYAAADVADEDALRLAAQKAVEEFGGIDTWVNNAGCSVYGRIMDAPTEDLRRLFETNVWGVVNGSKVAVEHLRDRGGALIQRGAQKRFVLEDSLYQRAELHPAAAGILLGGLALTALVAARR
jgi:NADP-dependent 3-hydroxy acid dehydrogenase YdfG